MHSLEDPRSYKRLQPSVVERPACLACHCAHKDVYIYMSLFVSMLFNDLCDGIWEKVLHLS
jgi:hypothetical protein